MSSSPASPGIRWREIVRKNGSPEFARAFAPDVVLRASALNGTVEGPELLAAFLGATSTMYETLEFTHEAVDANKTFLEWEGRFSGTTVYGSTILTFNDQGLVQSILLLQSPLSVVRTFSTELAARLKDKLTSDYFA